MSHLRRLQPQQQQRHQPRRRRQSQHLWRQGRKRHPPLRWHGCGTCGGCVPARHTVCTGTHAIAGLLVEEGTALLRVRRYRTAGTCWGFAGTCACCDLPRCTTRTVAVTGRRSGMHAGCGPCHHMHRTCSVAAGQPLGTRCGSGQWHHTRCSAAWHWRLGWGTSAGCGLPLRTRRTAGAVAPPSGTCAYHAACRRSFRTAAVARCRLLWGTCAGCAQSGRTRRTAWRPRSAPTRPR